MRVSSYLTRHLAIFRHLPLITKPAELTVGSGVNRLVLGSTLGKPAWADTDAKQLEPGSTHTPFALDSLRNVPFVPWAVITV